MLTGARTAIAQDRLLLVEDLRLDKKIAESGMRSVGSSQCDNHFCITREVDCLACPRAVRDANSPYLDVILRRNGNFRLRIYALFITSEVRACLRKICLIDRRWAECWLIRG